LRWIRRRFVGAIAIVALVVLVLPVVVARSLSTAGEPPGNAGLLGRVVETRPGQ
jgi:hypothetical protein